LPPLPLSIASAVNNSYVLPLAVMLTSLKQHLSRDLRPELYLLHAGIPDSSLELISSILDTHPILLSREHLSAAPRTSHFPPEAAAPLLLPELLPLRLERILFLDADMLVLDDLSELWATPLETEVLAAVRDAAVPDCASPRGVKGWQASGIPAGTPYFNCGLLLIDLERWRRCEVTPRVRRYLESTREPIDFLHQEGLNAVLWDNWKPLGARWNLLASHAGRPYGRIAPEAWQNPGLVHFSGRMKPWRAPIGGPFDAPYQKALESILPIIPSQPPTLRERVWSVYDRYFRAAFFPLEQFLWRRRLI
jgi:lipopolysaccharide biosynthesis glycosyltransferase